MIHIACADGARSTAVFDLIPTPGAPAQGFAETLLKKLNESPGITQRAEGLITKMSNLMETAEGALDRIAARLSLSLPPGFEFRQTVSMTRIKVVGFGNHGKRFEEALNNDLFFRHTFQAIRIQYTALRAFDRVPRSTYACFTIVFHADRLAFKAPARAGGTFDLLLKELEKDRDKNYTQMV